MRSLLKINQNKPYNPKWLLIGLILSLFLVYDNTIYAQKLYRKGIDTSLILKHLKGDKPLNIIFFLVDDQRYSDMGFLGHPFLETPNMDWMASHGFYFNRAIVTTSLCSPSRASIMTGRYAHNHSVINNFSGRFQKGTIIFPEYLQKAGYQTGFIGKFLGSASSGEKYKGYSYWAGLHGQGKYYHFTINENGKKVTYKDSTYVTALLTQKAIQFMNNSRKKGKPFFLYLSHKAVHGLWYPGPQDKGRYKNVKDSELPDFLFVDSLPKVNSKKLNERPRWVRDQRNSWHGAKFPLYKNEPNILKKLYKEYCETLLGVDRSLGRILDYLRKNDLMDNTMVIYMSDNGFQFGDHGLIDKRTSYKTSIRVPLLIYDPLYPEREGTKINKLVANIDIAPTILAAAGLKAPGYMDGRNLRPLMEGKSKNWRKYILYEYYWEYSYPMTPTQFALMGERYKYINYYGIWDTNELYDLKSDPKELHNLIDDPNYEDIVSQMRKALFDTLKKTGGMYIPLYPEGSNKKNLRNENIGGVRAANFPVNLLANPNSIKNY